MFRKDSNVISRPNNGLLGRLIPRIFCHALDKLKEGGGPRRYNQVVNLLACLLGWGGLTNKQTNKQALDK